MKKISIIVPVYNVEEFLEECINSVYTNQSISKENFEVIAVEDCSTDNSKKLLQTLEKKT